MSYKRDGEYKWWHDNGQLWKYFSYKDGKQDGEYKWWYDNGQLWGHCYYKDDGLNGEYKIWHKNGQLWKYFSYKDDKRDSEYKEWNNNGQLWEHCNYKNTASENEKHLLDIMKTYKLAVIDDNEYIKKLFKGKYYAQVTAQRCANGSINSNKEIIWDEENADWYINGFGIINDINVKQLFYKEINADSMIDIEYEYKNGNNVFEITSSPYFFIIVDNKEMAKSLLGNGPKRLDWKVL